MNRLRKTFGVAALIGVLITAGGCGGGGGGEAPVVVNPSVTAPVSATVNPDGTASTGTTAVTVAAPAGTPGYLATVSATLAPNTVITAKQADGTPVTLTAPPTLTFTAPADSTGTHSGVNGVPVPSGAKSVLSTSGAINVAVTGAASATFVPPITITMAVPGKAVGSVIDVYVVKEGSTKYTLLGNFPVTTAGYVSFPVSDFCHFVADPEIEPEEETTTPTTVPTTTPTTVPSTTVPTTVPTTTVEPTTIPTTVPTTTPTTVPTTTPTTVSTTVPPTTTTSTVLSTTTSSTVLSTTTTPTTAPTTVSTTVPPGTTTVATTTPTTISGSPGGTP